MKKFVTKNNLLKNYPFYLFILMIILEPFLFGPRTIETLKTKPLYWIEFAMLLLLIFSTILYATKKQFFLYVFFLKLIFNPFSFAFNYKPNLILFITTYIILFYNIYLHNNIRKKNNGNLFSNENQYIFIPLTFTFMIYLMIGYLYRI